MLPADYTRGMGINCPGYVAKRCARHRDIPLGPTAYSWVRTYIRARPGCEMFIPWEQP